MDQVELALTVLVMLGVPIWLVVEEMLTRRRAHIAEAQRAEEELSTPPMQERRAA
jgi:hypothetical protein